MCTAVLTGEQVPLDVPVHPTVQSARNLEYSEVPFDPEMLRKALDLTFSRRGSHPLPADLAAPAAAWDAPFAALAAETNLGLTIAVAFELVRAIYIGL